MEILREICSVPNNGLFIHHFCIIVYNIIRGSAITNIVRVGQYNSFHGV